MMYTTLVDFRKNLISMHELPVTQSILKIALEHAEKANAKRITDLHIVQGELSSMVDDSIQFYWEIIAKDTIAQNATLHFRRVPAELQCMACFQKYHPKDGELVCPNCGSVGAKIVAGEEFFVEAIDIDE
ncbi:MAG TPA: hydrogenase maturation nickel metallochaperone HypA [Anaerolineales bacterium]|nr:hydrogenase maturation nickel metallochaperone HypA [Anaerolineales bacterium]